MLILSIETSCDETAVSVIEATGDFPRATYTVRGNSLFSQIDIHREFGGVFPSVAKREHVKTIVPMFIRALEEANLLKARTTPLTPSATEHLYELLNREEGLADTFIAFLEKYEFPTLDLIAVTSGPGLEPALWVGINFAKALASVSNVPVVGVNHMEGHVLSSIFDGKTLPNIAFPAVSLLISGGHTELQLMKDWQTYTLLGATRDDAVGEAFDKVARMLGLPYPGGPEISRLSLTAREKNLPEYTKLPRPMIDTNDCDFSFSGLKTAVRYTIEKNTLHEEDKEALARDFEDAVTEVLLKKTKRAIDETSAKTLILGGGVTVNRHIRESFTSFFTKEYPDLALYLPDPKLSTDNSIMIALAGHARLSESHMGAASSSAIIADGNRQLSEK